MVVTTKQKIGLGLAAVQLVLSCIFLYQIYQAGLRSAGAVALIGIVLLALCALSAALELKPRSGVNTAGIVLSALVTLALLACVITAFSITRTIDRAVSDISGANTTTSNMVVVVRKDDPATVFAQTQNYVYGTQTEQDQENQNAMMEQVSATLLGDLTVKPYPNVQAEARALLAGEVQAAVYNEAFTDLLSESIENYTDQVKVLYTFNIEQAAATVEQVNPNAFLLYISGIDVSGPIDTNSRSDVNILMAVNTETHQITMVTTPRDYYVRIPNVSGDAKDKLTHAGIYGVNASMATLAELYGVDINYYARVNFSSFKTIVDALGGIDVENDTPFVTRSGQSFPVGTIHMDGETALAFSRERYNLQEGDNDRGKNQEKVLTAMIRKAASPAIVFSANEILSGISDTIQLSMPNEKVQQLIEDQKNSAAQWDIKSYAVTGTGDHQETFSAPGEVLYVMHPDPTSVQIASQALRDTLTATAQ